MLPMQNSQDKKTFVTIPNKGKIELSYLLDMVGHLRQFTWTYRAWKPTPALIDKSNGSSRQYVGQTFDPKYFDLVNDGWTHDHCEICAQTISDKNGYGDNEGYVSENGDWLCNGCHKLFIEPSDLEATIDSLKEEK
jgi:hypothetical protein